MNSSGSVSYSSFDTIICPFFWNMKDTQPDVPIFPRPLENALEKEGVPMASAEVTMIPDNYVTLTDPEDIKNLNRTLDLLDEDDDVQAVYHNWEEE